MLSLVLVVLSSLMEDYTFVGWTQDSAFFVVEAAYSIGDHKRAPPEYLVYPGWGDHGRTYRNAEWETFVKAHPLAPPCKDACRSPDGKRVAHRNELRRCDEFNGCAESVVPRFEPARGPRIQLKSMGLAPGTEAKAAAALDTAGFAVTSWEAAQAKRATSVVYAGKGQEALAKKLAEALPGGATVEPLTWKAKVDVVVALGSSAQ